MARITVEDCLEKVPNRFDLVLLASQRARELATGAAPTVPTDRDKPTLIALREIAAGGVRPEELRDALVTRMRRTALNEDDTEEVYGDDFHTVSRTGKNSAETLSADGRKSEAGQFESQQDGDPDDLAEMSEPSAEELAALEADIALHEDAA